VRLHDGSPPAAASGPGSSPPLPPSGFISSPESLPEVCRQHAPAPSPQPKARQAVRSSPEPGRLPRKRGCQRLPLPQTQQTISLSQIIQLSQLLFFRNWC
jgi:hypothetical protein